MPVTKVFLLLHDGQVISFRIICSGRGSVADRLSLLSNRGILAGRLGSRIVLWPVARTC